MVDNLDLDFGLPKEPKQKPYPASSFPVPKLTEDSGKDYLPEHIFGAFGDKRFTLPDFVKPDEVAQATTTLSILLGDRNKLDKILEKEREWTTIQRHKFADILDQMDRKDAHDSLNWLLATFGDLTNPASSLDLQGKILQWPHLGEQFIGAKAVGFLLLKALNREKETIEKELLKFEAETQAAAAKDTFEKLVAIKISSPGEKDKNVAPSSVPMSDGNTEKGRIRLYGQKLDEFDERLKEVGEQIDYVSQMAVAIADTYNLLLHVSIQNQGLRKNNIQQGA